MKDYLDKVREDCIKCGLCTKNCDFLTKYRINLKDFTNREDLRFSCFLCDKCRDVCPKDLSGKKVSLLLRKRNPANIGKLKFLKENYKFRNTSRIKSKGLLYLGCNYPGVYPETCEKLIEICRGLGVDYAVDCCKKPIAEQGEDVDQKNLLDLLRGNGADTLICTCPNCYHSLKNLEGIRVISVYEFLLENNLGKKIGETAEIFLPCSDRFNKEIFQYAKEYLSEYKFSYEKINCCGLGGGAMKSEKDLVDEKIKNIKDCQEENIYTYCSSCSLIFRKYGINNIKNILSEILEVKEKPSSQYPLNIIKFKFKRHYKVRGME